MNDPNSQALRTALALLLEHYLSLVKSGEAGGWDAEKEVPVILARAALKGAPAVADPLPPGMARVLAHVRQFIHAHGFPPTRQEIADALGFTSATGAHDHLKRLAQRGVVTLIEGQARGIRLNKRGLT